MKSGSSCNRTTNMALRYMSLYVGELEFRCIPQNANSRIKQRLDSLEIGARKQSLFASTKID